MKNDFWSYYALGGWTVISLAHAGAPTRHSRGLLLLLLDPLPEVRKMHTQPPILSTCCKNSQEKVTGPEDPQWRSPHNSSRYHVSTAHASWSKRGHGEKVRYCLFLCAEPSSRNHVSHSIKGDMKICIYCYDQVITIGLILMLTVSLVVSWVSDWLAVIST